MDFSSQFLWISCHLITVLVTFGIGLKGRVWRPPHCGSLMSLARAPVQLQGVPGSGRARDFTASCLVAVVDSESCSN